VRKEHEIEADPNVGLIFIDTKANAYLAITAQATVCRNPIKTAELWKTTDTMWWADPDDPNVCILNVEPLNAEIWDGACNKSSRGIRICKGPFNWSEAQSRGKQKNCHQTAITKHGSIDGPPTFDLRSEFNADALRYGNDAPSPATITDAFDASRFQSQVLKVLALMAIARPSRRRPASR
jgi:Pyridoxamine 5'-phosphate oxidase like